MQTHASNADLTITSQRPHTHTRPTKPLPPALTRPLPPSPKSTYDHRHQCHFFFIYYFYIRNSITYNVNIKKIMSQIMVS